MLRPLLWLCLNLICTGQCVADVTHYRYRVVESYPHDRGVFTQGLVYHQHKLYESAGHFGQSRLLVRTLQSTKPLLQHKLPDNIFAEGITLLDDKLYQLSWRSGRVFVYQPQTLEPLREFSIRGEGWGICHNGRELIVSNGSSTLQFFDPQTFELSRTLSVTLNAKPVTQLNELEWIDGLIYANVWQSDWIIMIDPDSGKVVGKAQLDKLLPKALRTRSTDVLNGIAYDRENKRLLVTGKYWPRIYHIELFQD